MPEQTIAINGHRVTRMVVSVPFSGVWSVEADYDQRLPVDQLEGRVDVQLGPTLLRGTLDPLLTGSFQLSSRCHVHGGAAAWSQQVPARAYHSDAGVRSKLVLDDLAREVGETWGTQVPPLVSLGNDFVRQAGPASRVLLQVLGTTPWWVDYAGVTHAGVRAQAEIVGQYEILDFDARFKVATIALDDPGAIGIGSVLRARLDEPRVVRELTINVTPDQVRVKAWCPETTTWGANRLLRDLETITREALPELPFLGTYRYRVVLPNPGDHRWVLQAVASGMGLPDISPVSVHPGVAGAVAQLALGSVVLVSFIEGSPSMPYIHAFTPRDQSGYLPVELALDATTRVQVGPSADLVEIGSGTETPPPADPTGRVIRYGDTIALPPPISADYVLIPGNVPMGVAKVRA